MTTAGARPRISVIGLGQMGSQHARVTAASDAASLHSVVDLDEGRARSVADGYGCKWGTGLEAVDGADAVVVATPTESHVTDALSLIGSGMPVLIEKPVAEDLAEVEEVLGAAADAGIPLMCGFVERHNPAVVTALSLLEAPVNHALALRHSPPADRIKTSVVWDLLIHDIDLALRISGHSAPARIQSSGWHSSSGSLEIADCSITHSDGMLATLSASRAGQHKVRMWNIATDGQLIELDLLRQDVTVYRSVTQEAGSGVGYRAQTVVDIPYVRHGGEPLDLQLEHFVSLLDGRGDVAEERESTLAPHRIASHVAQTLPAPGAS